MMSIADIQTKSILLFSLDALDEEEGKADDAKNATSGKGGTETEQDLLDKALDLDKWLKSDSNDYLKRIPIVIDDQLIPAHHVGSSTNMNKFVDYDATEVVVEPASNGLAIQIQIKNSLSELSTAADIFSGLIGLQFDLFTTYPRVSFFSPNTCIFNAYLSGITRQTSLGSDLEAINLSLERSPPKPDKAAKAGTDKENDPPANKLDNTTGGDDPETAATTTEPPNNTEGRLFTWYALMTLEEVQASEVPQIFGPKTVENLDYEAHITRTYDFEGTLREIITIYYNEIYIALGLNGMYPYYNDGYAVDLVDGYIVLGVEAA